MNNAEQIDTYADTEKQPLVSRALSMGLRAANDPSLKGEAIALDIQLIRSKIPDMNDLRDVRRANITIEQLQQQGRRFTLIWHPITST